MKLLLDRMFILVLAACRAEVQKAICVVSASAKVPLNNNSCAELPHASQQIDIAAMRGERENVQLVISPTICEKQPCKFTPTFSDLVDPRGNVIDASSFSWLEVGYVNAKKTTRYSPSGGGWLADPLLHPLIDPATSRQMFVSRPDGSSNALWISLGVPADASPGEYSGTVSIQPTTAAQQDSASIGVTVTVWPLELPTVKEIHQNFPEIWSFNTGSLKVMLRLFCMD